MILFLSLFFRYVYAEILKPPLAMGFLSKICGAPFFQTAPHIFSVLHAFSF